MLLSRCLIIIFVYFLGEKKLIRHISALVELLTENMDTDGYDKISFASDTRKITLKDYQTAYGISVQDLPCMITGVTHNSICVPNTPQPKCPIILSHLLPRSAAPKEYLKLGMNKSDLDCIKNTLILCKGIEEAFDRKKISFIPADIPFSAPRLKLCIWDDRIRDKPIYECAGRTIGDFEGNLLQLNVNGLQHNPFKRTLYYQAYRSFKTHHKRLALYDLPEDCDISTYNGTYVVQRAKFASQLCKDLADDAA